MSESMGADDITDLEQARDMIASLRPAAIAAVDEGLATYNLSAKIALPKAKTDAGRILTVAEAQTLLYSGRRASPGYALSRLSWSWCSPG